MVVYKLGPLPWSNETLERAYWKDFMDAYDSIKQHPGFNLHEHSLSLKSALRMFNKAADSFLATLDKFHTEAHERQLFSRIRRDDLREFEEKFQEALYFFSSCSMTLVDQSRSLSNKVEIPCYKERVSSTFANNARHKFIQELRNDLIHVTLHQPCWLLSTEPDHSNISRLVLHAHQLKRSGGWNKLAKEYLCQHSEGVDLGKLIQEYRTQVNHFQEWLQAQVIESVGRTIDDYLRCDQFLKNIGVRCWWRLLLSQVVIQNGRDPYQYLDQYLTRSELEEIQILPQSSKKQVDRIVEIIDDSGACNDELRSLAYKAFGVAIP